MNLSSGIKSNTQAFLLEQLKRSVEENGGKFYQVSSVEGVGEILIKLVSPPGQIITAGLDKDAKPVIEALSKKFGWNTVDLENIKEEPKSALKTVSVGITGADAVASESGSVLFRDYTLAIGAAAFLPEKHVVIASAEKVVPTILDAYELIWSLIYQSGKVPSRIEAIQGPSKTGDIEKKIIRPSHGPREFHLIVYG